jgi:hypothetical protein
MRRANYMSLSKRVAKLTANDRALDRKAQSKSFDELSKPFREAFRGVSEDEIDRIVQARRANYRLTLLTPR